MYEIMAHEIRYINQDKPQVSVLFSITLPRLGEIKSVK